MELGREVVRWVLGGAVLVWALVPCPVSAQTLVCSSAETPLAGDPPSPASMCVEPGSGDMEKADSLRERYTLLPEGALDEMAISLDLHHPGEAPLILYLPPLSNADEPTVEPHSPGEEVHVSAPPGKAKRGGLSYSLSDRLTADLGYRHALLSGLARTDKVLASNPADFSTDPDRDVFNLGLSWHLAKSTLGLGYRFESSRAYTVGQEVTPSLFPEHERSLHSFTLGITREWGAAPTSDRPEGTVSPN